MNKLITEVKNENQDYEFYPTTNEIISYIISDIKSINDSCYYSQVKSSLLDIGSGSGKVLLAINRELPAIEDLYAIEKSQILRNNLDKSIYIVGTDFYEQSLLDKYIDITFSNPPYSDYEQWTVKILRESSSSIVYLVLPERWKKSDDIKNAMEYREAKFKILGNFDFLNAEDRKARAVVDLIRVDLDSDKDDAFNRLFNTQFNELKEKFEDTKDYSKKEESREKESKEVTAGDNYVKNLISMYKNKMLTIKNNYDMIGKLDRSLLREFDIFPDKVMKLLKDRICGLKNTYWNDLVSHIGELTSRLTTKNRKQLIEKLFKNSYVDFTEENVYSVVVWILKNANQYIDNQLTDVYERMISKANIKNYKSNVRVYVNDKWRYSREEESPTNVALEYRLVLESCGKIERDFSGRHTLNSYACDFIRDLLTVANNLNFAADTTDSRLDSYNKNVWEPGKSEIFTYSNNSKTLFEIKAHLNGNIHIKMNSKFALALNVEYGRLKGWIHSKEQASYELQDDDSCNYFKSNANFSLTDNKISLLANYDSSSCIESDK